MFANLPPKQPEFLLLLWCFVVVCFVFLSLQIFSKCSPSRKHLQQRFTMLCICPEFAFGLTQGYNCFMYSSMPAACHISQWCYHTEVSRSWVRVDKLLGYYRRTDAFRLLVSVVAPALQEQNKGNSEEGRVAMERPSVDWTSYTRWKSALVHHKVVLVAQVPHCNIRSADFPIFIRQHGRSYYHISAKYLHVLLTNFRVMGLLYYTERRLSSKFICCLCFSFIKPQTEAIHGFVC